MEQTSCEVCEVEQTSCEVCELEWILNVQLNSVEGPYKLICKALLNGEAYVCCREGCVVRRGCAVGRCVL